MNAQIDDEWFVSRIYKVSIPTKVYTFYVNKSKYGTNS